MGRGFTRLLRCCRCIQPPPQPTEFGVFLVYQTASDGEALVREICFIGWSCYSNNTRMLRAILNKSWQQHPTKHQLYSHLPPTTKTIQVRRTRHAGHCWRSRDELISDVLLWTPHMAEQKQDDQLEHTYSSYVRIRDVALKTCLRR